LSGEVTYFFQLDAKLHLLMARDFTQRFLYLLRSRVYDYVFTNLIFTSAEGTAVSKKKMIEP
jgi:hypothetical protein